MKLHWRITAWYLVFGVVWVFATDRLIDPMADAGVFTALQTMKGWVFIVLSAVLIFILTKRAAEERASLEAEKLAVFRKTVEGAHHILLNYVNQMQIVTMAAENCPDFDPAALRTADEISARVVAELKKLDHISHVTSDEIDAVIYEDIRKRS
jgi:hypothetical protein